MTFLKKIYERKNKINRLKLNKGKRKKSKDLKHTFRFEEFEKKIQENKAYFFNI